MYFVVFLFVCFFGQNFAADTVENEIYKFSVERNNLQNEEIKFAGYDVSLDGDEKIVNSYLEYLKWEEFINTRSDFAPARPLKLHLKRTKASKVYGVLKKLPKGGNMHLHHNHVVSKSILLDIIMASPEYDNFYVKTEEPHKWQLDFFVNPPTNWARIKDNTTYYTKDRLLKHIVFTEVMDDIAVNMPTNGQLRWKEMGPLFSLAGSHLICNVNITAKYMKALLQAAKDENVQYVEAKASAYKKTYVLDGNPAYASRNGKRLIDNDDGELELNITRSVIEEFVKQNPDFIGYKRIINTYRGSNKYYVNLDLQRAYRLYKKYPDLVSGFDMVSEEDKGYSLLFFLEDFAKMEAEKKSIPYFFHTAETNWPDDLIPSYRKDDPVSSMQNTYEAIILGAKRVGHGIGYTQHPYLMTLMKERKIAVEVNPVSNQMLGYVVDQRHHPGITYLRFGIPIVLGADDPSTFGYDEFTVDWYEAYMSWGLNLADLRQIANNSLQYSSLSETHKVVAFTKWKAAWKKYIQEMKTEACNQDFGAVTAVISSIFPGTGHISGGTNISVFGRNFQGSICKQILCKFGSVTSYGQYIYNHEIKCPAPSFPASGLPQGNDFPHNVPFSVSLDGGKSYVQTSLNFTYFHNVVATSGGFAFG